VGRLAAEAIDGLPEVRAGDDLGELIVATGARPSDLDVVVVAHKVVSKSEGRVVALESVRPGPRAVELAGELGKDPRHVEVVLRESTEILRAERGVLISRTRHGYVCANAGVDASNTAEPETLILLPDDPDASARALRRRMRELVGTSPAVLITDSFGRAWRHGQCDVAVGCAGVSPLEDWRGRVDSSGRELLATWIAVADEIAAAADLARSKDGRQPVVVVSGLGRLVCADDGPGAAALVRAREGDLFG
jgi:coenzyme F420-0:L-glutamate ligase/coenzyme F420-1:gamma-L-glutamate ligase